MKDNTQVRIVNMNLERHLGTILTYRMRKPNEKSLRFYDNKGGYLCMSVNDVAKYTKQVQHINKELAEALDCLAGMWNQYCGPKVGHMFMSAGEDTEDILEKYKLMRQSEGFYGTAIDMDDDDYPYPTPKAGG